MDRSSILRASTNSYRQVEKCFYLLFYYLQIPRRIELYAGRGRKENASAFLARGRGRRQAAEAGAYLRSKYADSPRNAPAQNRCAADGISANYAPAPTDPPHPRRIELCAGRGRKENATATQGGTRFPNGGPGGNRIPESSFGMGYIFRMGCWRKAHPGIPSQIGTRFPLHLLNSKTYAPSIPKLGRRKPKRNRRRSI